MNTYEFTLLVLVLNRDGGLAAFVDDTEGEVLHVLLDVSLVHLATNETLGIKDRVLRVGVVRVLGRVSDQSLVVRERDPRRSYPVTLVVGDNFDTTTALYTMDSR